MSIVVRMLARRVFVLGLAATALFVVLASFAAPSRAEQLVASWYGVGDGFAGLTTANGETFDPYAYTAAHKTLPFDTKLRVTYGGESVVVRINDRGPYIEGRDLDLSYAAARDIGLVSVGSAPVEVEYVDASTPVGPVQTSGVSQAQSAPEPIQEPIQEPAQEPAQESAPAPEPAVASQAAVAPQVSSEPVEESAGLIQYSGGEQAVDDQYADADQYEPNAAGDQYGSSGSELAGEPVEPSGTDGTGAPSAASEFTPQQAEAETDPAQAQARTEAPEAEVEQPSPANFAPAVEELEEPPEELVKPGTTVEHRVEMKIAAAPGTATDSPDTPSLAPAPVNDVLVSGGSEASDKVETPDQAEAPEEPLPGEGEESQEVEIEVLPDTGGWIQPPSFSLADLVAVLMVGAMLKIGFGRLRGQSR